MFDLTAVSELHDQNLCGPSHGRRGELRVGELRVLPDEILFDHPTGGRAGLSNKDGDFQIRDLG